MIESYNTLKQSKNRIDTNQQLQQRLTLDFMSGIIMIENSDIKGHDDIDKICSLKLLKNTDCLNVYFEMISMKYCHIEWISCFFRQLTLILNSEICAKYILQNLVISKTLKHLIPIIKETINTPNYAGYSESAFNAAQELAFQIFYQFEIWTTNLDIRDDVFKYLKKNENKLYRFYAYPMAQRQIEAKRDNCVLNLNMTSSQAFNLGIFSHHDKM